MTQAPESSQMHVANLCGPQPFRKDRPVELRIVSRFGDAAYIDNALDVVHPQKFKERFPCAGRMSNGQHNGQFWRCHTNQVLWSSSLASETVSRGSKLAAVTSFHCSIGDFNVVVFSAAADADCANHRSIRIFEGYSAAKSCAAPRLLKVYVLKQVSADRSGGNRIAVHLDPWYMRNHSFHGHESLAQILVNR